MVSLAPWLLELPPHCRVALGGSQEPGIADHAFAPQNLYDSIRNEPFKIPEDDGNDLTHTFFNPDREGWLLKLGTSLADSAGCVCRGEVSGPQALDSAFSRTRYVTLGQRFHLSEPQFPHMKNGPKISSALYAGPKPRAGLVFSAP